jgi:branched-chain amino acid transport system substrate-binding protein
MKLWKFCLAATGAAVVAAPMLAAPAAAQNEQFIPMLVYRTGPYAPSGIPVANGFRDYYTLINKRDGGINGVKVTFEECETKYNTKLGVECYEKLKNKGPTGASLVNPFSTGITYQLIPKASVDKVPILSMGYGRTAAADGRVFEWIFNFPTTYWSQASAFVRYVAQQEGGEANLKGKKIAHVYHNSAYGKEANPTLETLAKKYGYELTTLAVDHPGQEQKATWLQIRRLKPDWIFMSGWGVMNQVAIKEAAGIRYPMDHFIGNWWSGSDADVIPAGSGAVGYKSTAFHAAGTGFNVHKDIIKYVYGGDEAKAKENNIGEVLYNRTLVNAMFGVEAIRTAQAKFGNKPLTGELGPREPQRHRGAAQGDRNGGLHQAGQGELRGPRDRRPDHHPAVGRQAVEVRQRLGAADPRSGAPHGREGRGGLRQGEQHHAAQLSVSGSFGQRAERGKLVP